MPRGYEVCKGGPAEARAHGCQVPPNPGPRGATTGCKVAPRPRGIYVPSRGWLTSASPKSKRTTALRWIGGHVSISGLPAASPASPSPRLYRAMSNPPLFSPQDREGTPLGSPSQPHDYHDYEPSIDLESIANTHPPGASLGGNSESSPSVYMTIHRYGKPMAHPQPQPQPTPTRSLGLTRCSVRRLILATLGEWASGSPREKGASDQLPARKTIPTRWTSCARRA